MKQPKPKKPAFGTMEIKRKTKPVYGAPRNMDAVRKAEAIAEEKWLDEMLGEF